MVVPKLSHWDRTYAAIVAGTLTSAMIGDNEIVNADINSAAAIAFSKLAALDSAKILVGSAGNVATKVAMTGNVAITNAGVTTVKGVQYQHHTGKAIADLTAVFGDPAGLADGTIGVYKNDTDAKVYHVSVVGGVFYLLEQTAVLA